MDTAPDLAERSRPRRPRLAVYNKIGEPVSDLFVGGYTVITGSESLECAVSHALSVQDVAEGGHRCFDTRLGDPFRTEFHLSYESWPVDETFRRKSLGTSEKSEARHRRAGGVNGCCLLYDVGLGTY